MKRLLLIGLGIATITILTVWNAPAPGIVNGTLSGVYGLPSNVVTNDIAAQNFINQASITDPSAQLAVANIVNTIRHSTNSGNFVGVFECGSRFNPSQLKCLTLNNTMSAAPNPNYALPEFTDLNRAVFTNGNGIVFNNFSCTNYTMVIIHSMPSDTVANNVVITGGSGIFPYTTQYNFLATIGNTNDGSGNVYNTGVGFGYNTTCNAWGKTGSASNLWSSGWNWLANNISQYQPLKNSGVRHPFPFIREPEAFMADNAGHEWIYDDTIPSYFTGNNISQTLNKFGTNFNVIYLGGDTNIAGSLIHPLPLYYTNYYGYIESIWLWSTTNPAVVDTTETASRFENTATKDIFIYGTSELDPTFTQSSSVSLRPITNSPAYWFSTLDPNNLVHDFSQASSSMATMLTNAVSGTAYPLNPVIDLPYQYPSWIVCDGPRNDLIGQGSETSKSPLQSSAWMTQYFTPITNRINNFILFETPCQATNTGFTLGPTVTNNPNLMAGWVCLETNPMVSQVCPIYKSIGQNQLQTNNMIFQDGTHPIGFAGGAGPACLMIKSWCMNTLFGTPIPSIFPDSLPILSLATTNNQSGLTYIVIASASSNVQLYDPEGRSQFSAPISGALQLTVPPLWWFTNTSITATSYAIHN